LKQVEKQQENVMTTEKNRAGWTTVAILAGRLIFAMMFIMAVSFKLMDISSTAKYILCFLTGAWFSEAALLAVAYVLFLAVAFHGPSHWKANQDEFGFFADHFTFIAGLLFAAAHGPGRVLAVKRGWIARQYLAP
jgi:putative oxidoreductase